MNLADFFGGTWLRVDIGIEKFEVMRLCCRTCRRHQPAGQGHLFPLRNYQRKELVELGARVLFIPREHPGGYDRWDLVVPFAAFGKQLIQYHLLHEIEATWDQRLLSTKELVAEQLGPWVRLLPLTQYGALPTTPRRS